MRREQWDLRPDAVQRALEAFQPRSSGQIMREAFYGVRRFDDFVAHTGLTPAVVSARLKALVDDEMLVRIPYRSPGERGRQEYHLTDRSRDLLPVIVALLRWSDRWLPAPLGPTLTIRHRDCGHQARVEVSCELGHRLGIDDVVAEPGAGARPSGAPLLAVDDDHPVGPGSRSGDQQADRPPSTARQTPVT